MPTSPTLPGTSPKPTRPSQHAGSLAIAAFAVAGLFGLVACPGAPGDQSTAGSAQTGAKTRGGPQDGGPTESAARLEVDIFAFGRVLGQIAPCGCTSLPLGGLQYAFGYIEGNSQAGARLVLEPGSLLYPSADHPEAPTDAAGWAQAEQRAKLLHERFSELGESLVSGLGPADFANDQDGAEGGPNGKPLRYALPRVLANTQAPIKGVATHLVRTLGVTKDPANQVLAVVSAVADPSVQGSPEGFPALSEPIAAARKALAAAPEAQLSIVMAIGPRSFAEQLARELDVDIVVMGGAVPGVKIQQEGKPVARIGDTYLLQPGDRAQTLSHLTLRLDAKSPAVAAAGPWVTLDDPKALQAQIDLLEARIEKFQADPEADPAFIAQNQQKLAALKASGSQEPSDPALASFAQVAVTCQGVADASAKAGIHDYEAWVANENKQRFAGKRTPEAAKGSPSYVGIDTCADCHDEAVTQWKTTVHAGAYETLEKANKQFDLTCVGCHVTGFREPSGPEVVETRGLVDVQCEQCHGPGSQHAEDPSTDNIRREVPESVCASCHTPEHSDTFEYTAYLRDALGTGHGAEAHAALGAGPRAAELRAAALAAAGGGCKKM